MLEQYFPVLLFILVGVGVGVALLTVGRLVAPNRPDPEKILTDDPTEAVRSEDVLSLARRFFQVDAEYPYGGGLLNLLLYEVSVNFDEDNSDDVRLLQVLCDAEDRLTRSGLIEPDFFIFVGSRRA